MAFDKVLYKYDSPHGQGDVYFIWQKGQTVSLLATTGADGTVAVFNRQGQLIERIKLSGLCSGFAWDNEGALLGIIAASSPSITVWDAITLEKIVIESGLRDALSCILWSKHDKLLAVGTTRGNLSIYNHKTRKKTPVLGKHSKRIGCGAWSEQNLLALGSDDKSFSLNNMEGDTIRIIQLRDVPSDMYFAEMASDDQSAGDNAISMIIGKRTLYLYYLPEPERPTELGFQSRYGALLQHKWFGNGYILLGFSNGHVVAISTHPKDIGQELWQVKNHKELLTGLAYCSVLELVASCGDDTIKTYSITNLHETERIITLPDRSTVQMMDWSSDGQLLAAATTSGTIYIYVTKLQTLYDASTPRIAILSSLNEVSIYNYPSENPKNLCYRQNLEFEPTFIGVGPYHLAVGFESYLWFYDLSQSLETKPQYLSKRDFSQPIQEVKLNAEYFAVFSPPVLILQSILTDNEKYNEKLMQTFPQAIPTLADVVINCFALTAEYLIYSSDIGHIIYFSLDKWEMCTVYRHHMGINKLFPDNEGTKLIFIDDHQQGYIFLPAVEELILINEFPKTSEICLWDLAKPQHFIVYDNRLITSYIFIRYSINGKHTVKLKGETKLNHSQLPVLMYEGNIVLYIDGGQIDVQLLNTHLLLSSTSPKINLQNLLQLRNYNEAFKICEEIDERTSWLELAEQALADLETQIALRAYRKINEIPMVNALTDICYIEDIQLLCGFCCVLLKKYEEAKEFFLKNTAYTKNALDLCTDLLQWQQALQLAEKYQPNQVPFIAREYAQQLEFNGNYADALYYYEKGYKEDLVDDSELQQLMNSTPEYEEHVRICKMGIARTSIRAGDFRRGIQYAVELNDNQLLYDCGNLLATVGHLTEAASLYERADYYDEACSLYISLKMWHKINQILPQVKSTKLHNAYAKAKETDGQFEEAIKSYNLAGNVDACVRIYLDHFCDPHSASEIVMETRSIESCKLLANFYQKIGDIEQALQFLIMCGCIEESFTLAQRHRKLKNHGELLQNYENVKPTDYLALAQYFEDDKYTLLAGKYYFLAGEFTKALKFLLKASTFTNEEPQALSLAIDCAATSNNELLVGHLIDFLLGEVDGSPKDPRYLFRLYMARRHFKEAAKTAVIIANQEQLSGNYKIAHDLLFSMFQELRRNNLPISAEMRHQLTLLHRYTLVRIHIKLGNHLLAAKLLLQIAANVSQFPLHIVQILTSTVIECNRSGLKKSAFKYASVLMKPEHRKNLDVRYAKKIESIVRKAPKSVKNCSDEIDDETMECPICTTNLSNMEVTCNSCKTTLPICIATGQHIIKQHMTSCPACDFPCFRAEMENILSELNECPMCDQQVAPEHLLDIEDIRPYILAAT